MGKREKVLVVQTSFLGDVVLTTPLLAEIRCRFPNSEMSVLCTPEAKSLLERNPDIDGVITDDKKGEGAGWTGLWRKAKDLRARGFTLAFSPHKSFRTGLLLFLAGIPCRVGFRQSGGWFFYHRRVNRNPALHDVQRNLSLLEPFGVDPKKCQRNLRVEVDPGTRDAVRNLFSSLGIERRGCGWNDHRH